MKYQPHYQLTRTEVEEKKKPFAGRYECHICVATFNEIGIHLFLHRSTM